MFLCDWIQLKTCLDPIYPDQKRTSLTQARVKNVFRFYSKFFKFFPFSLFTLEQKFNWTSISFICKGNRAFADFRYGEEDNTSLSTLIFTATKG